LYGNKISDISPLGRLAKLNQLGLGNNAIKDLKPLEYLINLSGLELAGNGINDINSLRVLTNLDKLDLDRNEITDILPLVENHGLGSGDFLGLTRNQLDETSISKYVPQLKNRGVKVRVLITD